MVRRNDTRKGVQVRFSVKVSRNTLTKTTNERALKAVAAAMPLDPARLKEVATGSVFKMRLSPSVLEQVGSEAAKHSTSVQNVTQALLLQSGFDPRIS